jgi:hypothetical protein
MHADAVENMILEGEPEETKPVDDSQQIAKEL